MRSCNEPYKSDPICFSSSQQPPFRCSPCAHSLAPVHGAAVINPCSSWGLNMPLGHVCSDYSFCNKGPLSGVCQQQGGGKAHAAQGCVVTDRSVCSGMGFGFPPSIPTQHTAASSHHTAATHISSGFCIQKQARWQKKLFIYIYTHTHNVVPCASVFLFILTSGFDRVVSLLTQVLMLPLEGTLL